MGQHSIHHNTHSLDDSNRPADYRVQSFITQKPPDTCKEYWDLDAEFSIDVRQAFIARKKDLRTLATLLTERIGELEIDADCSDGLKRKFSTIGDLIEYDNPSSKEITRVRLTARSPDFKKRGEVDLSGSTWRGISIHLVGRDDVVRRLKESILDVVAEMRPMYSWLHQHDFVYFALFTQLIISCLPAGLVATGVIHFSDDSALTSQKIAQLVLIGLIAPGFAVLLGTLANRFRDRFFPKAAFAIGHAERRLQRLERVQIAAVLGFIISFAASVIVAIWQAWMT